MMNKYIALIIICFFVSLSTNYYMKNNKDTSIKEALKAENQKEMIEKIEPLKQMIKMQKVKIPSSTKINQLSLNDYFDMEKIDNKWANRIETNLMMDAEERGASLDVECRSTLCKGNLSIKDAPESLTGAEKTKRLLDALAALRYSQTGMQGDISFNNRMTLPDGTFAFEIFYGRNTGTLHDFRAQLNGNTEEDFLKAQYLTQKRNLAINKWIKAH